MAEDRDRLRDCLLDIERFLAIGERDQNELLGYWIWLQEERTMGALYRRAFSQWESLGANTLASETRRCYVANKLGIYLWHAGLYEEAESLYRSALEKLTTALREDYPDVLNIINN